MLDTHIITGRFTTHACMDLPGNTGLEATIFLALACISARDRGRRWARNAAIAGARGL